MYFGGTHNDPLYEFTEQGIKDYLFRFFEHYMEPAVLYLQEIFSSPISLDYVSVPPLSDATDPDDIKIICPNFKYEPLQRTKMSCWKAWESLTRPFDKTPSHKNSWVTMISVKVPKTHNHSFWQTELDPYKPVQWEDIDSDNAIEFQVSRWGPSQRHANYHATQRAKDIIRCV